MDATASERTLIGVPGLDLEPVKRPSREEAMDAVRTLIAWAGDDPRRQARIEALFATSPTYRWNEGRVLDRYELLYEAGLVAEAARDQDRPVPAAAPGRAMASDHRRILATGLPAGRAAWALLDDVLVLDYATGD